MRSFPLTQRNVVDGSGRTVSLLFPLPDIVREDHCLSCSPDVCSTSPALFLSPDTVIAGQQKALLKARADEGSPGILLSPFFPSPTSQCWGLDLRSPLPISALFKECWDQSLTGEDASRVEDNGELIADVKPDLSSLALSLHFPSAHQKRQDLVLPTTRLTVTSPEKYKIICHNN